MPLRDIILSNSPDLLWGRLRELADSAHIETLQAAYRLAARVHTDQWRNVATDAAQVPYIVHPLRVACIMAGEWKRRDFPALATCLLHDGLENCAERDRSSLGDEIERLAGLAVCEAVWKITKPAPGPAELKASRDARYFAELRGAPEWVRLIKCADRVDNLRDARAWGDPIFWERYSSETIGWHLYLAHETAPIAEVALFKALVEGERTLRGRVPVWADGHLIDPAAASLIPEHIATRYQVVGLALRGETLLVGLLNTKDEPALEAITRTTRKRVEPIGVSAEAIRDAHAARLFGKIAAS